jgi:hypothetical protein
MIARQGRLSFATMTAGQQKSFKQLQPKGWQTSFSAM